MAREGYAAGNAPNSRQLYAIGRGGLPLAWCGRSPLVAPRAWTRFGDRPHHCPVVGASKQNKNNGCQGPHHLIVCTLAIVSYEPNQFHLCRGARYILTNSRDSSGALSWPFCLTSNQPIDVRRRARLQSNNNHGNNKLRHQRCAQALHVRPCRYFDTRS